jgi:hypothetical protein
MNNTPTVSSDVRETQDRVLSLQGYLAETIQNCRDDGWRSNEIAAKIVSEIRDSITKLPPPVDPDIGEARKLDRLIAELRSSAERSSEASRMLAEAKSLRQDHDPPRSDLYMWLKPEQTLEWRAADALAALRPSSDGV